MERGKMKKIIALAAAGALVAALALSGCSSSSSESSSSTTTTDADTSAAYTLVKDGTLTVGTSPDYPPFENLEDGEIVGFEPDLVNAIAEKLGLDVEFVQLDFDSIITAVDAGTQIDVGMSGFSITPERAKIIDFSDSFYVDNIAVATKIEGKYTTEESLETAGIKIAVQSGTTGESMMKENYPDAEIVSYKNSNDCFAALEADRVDAVCTNDAVVKSMVSGSYTDAAIIKTIATGEEYGVVVNKNNTALTAAINDAIAELEADGTIDSLLTKWF